MDTAVHFGYLILILGLIVYACYVFTNAIEHLGEELNLSQGAVGSVLAAIGTALPETIIPLVAIIGGYLAGGDVHLGNEIGIGAILGAPFMLGTLSMFLTGVVVYIFARLGKRTLHMPINSTLMLRDIRFFFAAYFIAITSSFIPIKELKYFVAFLLIAIYVVYVFRTIRAASGASDEDDELDELLIKKIFKTDKLFFHQVLVQVVLSVIAIVILAHFFVENIKYVAELFSINPLILSLLITPVATELPENFNSIIWIKAKKDTLAVGCITGTMVFQSCILSAIGLAMTPWVLNQESIVSVIIVYLSMGLIYINIVKNRGVLTPNILILSGIFYFIYILYVLTI